MPNLFIVGAMKAGTTSAYLSLAGSTDVYVSRHKEPHYFSADLHSHPHTLMRRTLHNFQNNEFVERLDEYLNLFRGAPSSVRYVVDASTSYLYSLDAARLIHKFNPESKIIIFLRDPINRAWSEYNMNRMIGVEYHGFVKAIKREQRAVQSGAPYLYKRYTLAGAYAEQIARYQQLFSPENIFIDVIDRPGDRFSGAFRRLTDFLDLPPLPVRHENAAKSATNGPWNSILYYSGMKALISRSVPVNIKEVVKQSYYSYREQDCSAADRLEVAEYFYHTNAQLADMTGLDLSHWRNDV